MAHLVSVGSLITRGKLNDSEELRESLAAILDATSLHLAAVLRTEFDKVIGQVDQFWVDPTERPFTGDMMKLFLSRGFVNGSVDIKLASTLDELADETSLDQENIKLDAQRGLILVSDWEFNGLPRIERFHMERFFGQVTYNAGFDVGEVEFGEEYVGVPSWLKELATQMALGIHREGCTDKEAACKCAGPGFMALMEKYVRFYPSALKPLI